MSESKIPIRSLEGHPLVDVEARGLAQAAANEAAANAKSVAVLTKEIGALVGAESETYTGAVVEIVTDSEEPFDVTIDTGETVTLYNHGKNFMPRLADAIDQSGVVATPNEDGSISIVGTATSTAYVDLIKSSKPMYLPAGDYVLSFDAPANVMSCVICRKSDNSALVSVTYAAKAKAFSLDAGELVYAYLSVYKNNAVDTAVSIQLERGEGITAATAFEPYVGYTLETGRRCTIEPLKGLNIMHVSNGSTLTVSSQTIISAINNRIDLLDTYVTPEMYGAKGDGAADDTGAIQAAIDSGKLVHFVYGRTYLISSALRITRNDTVIIGNGATVKLKDGVDDNVMAISYGVRRTTIERLTLSGNGANQHGIYLDRTVVSMRFYQVRIENNGKSGLKVATNTYANQFVECTFTGNAENGIEAISGGTSRAIDTTDFNLCMFTNNGNAGVYANIGVSKFFGGWFEGNDIGIIMSAEQASMGSVAFYGVDFEGNHKHVMKFVRAEGKTFDGVRISGGQVCGSETNESMFYFDAPEYAAFYDLVVDSNYYPIHGLITDSKNPVSLYVKDYPMTGLPDDTKIRIYIDVDRQYVTDSDKVQRYIVGAKPIYTDRSTPFKYALAPGESVQIRLDTPCLCAKVKCTSASTIQLLCLTIVNGNIVQQFAPTPTVTDGVHEFALNTDTSFVMLKNSGETDTEISDILWTGRLPMV